MDGVIEALKGTPWWVYLLFVFLVYIGVSALKPHIISIKKIFILPLVFFAWSLYGLFASFQGFGDITIWVFFIVLGSIAGWGLTQRVKIRADKKKLLIGMPGSPMILVLILFIFGIKYFFGYYTATHPLAHENSLFHFASLIISALITGVFFGRILCCLRNLQRLSTPS